MKAHLTITADNAAFGETREEAAYELARILEQAARNLQMDPEGYGRCYETLRDANGKDVGRFCFKGEDDPGYSGLR